MATKHAVEKTKVDKNLEKLLSQPKKYKLIVEKDVPIPMRDGAIIYADVFRPDCKEKVPAIMNLSVYHKDKLWVPPEDLEEKPNPHMNWESANPLWWCPRWSMPVTPCTSASMRVRRWGGSAMA